MPSSRRSPVCCRAPRATTPAASCAESIRSCTGCSSRSAIDFDGTRPNTTNFDPPPRERHRPLSTATLASSDERSSDRSKHRQALGERPCRSLTDATRTSATPTDYSSRTLHEGRREHAVSGNPRGDVDQRPVTLKTPIRDDTRRHASSLAATPSAGSGRDQVEPSRTLLASFGAGGRSCVSRPHCPVWRCPQARRSRMLSMPSAGSGSAIRGVTGSDTHRSVRYVPTSSGWNGREHARPTALRTSSRLRHDWRRRIPLMRPCRHPVR